MCELRHVSLRMLCDVLVRGGLPMALDSLILCMPIVECVCPHCFSALPSCTWETNSKCPSDTTITENIALVAAVSSATAIAGGKLFKMPAVMAQKYLRMFTSAPANSCVYKFECFFSGFCPGATKDRTTASHRRLWRPGLCASADSITAR